MFTQPSSLFSKLPMTNTFWKQNANQNPGFFAPFSGWSGDNGSTRNKNNYIDCLRVQNQAKGFTDGSDKSRYCSTSDTTDRKCPLDNWNDRLDIPTKTARNDSGLEVNDADNQNPRFFAPFSGWSGDNGSTRNKDDYTDCLREQNHAKAFTDGSDKSRYYSTSDTTDRKRPLDNWNDHIDMPTKKARNDSGLEVNDADNLHYECIDYGHGKIGPSVYDNTTDQPSSEKCKSRLRNKDLPKRTWLSDQEFFQLFEDGLDLMIQGDDSIQAILKFDTRLSLVLSPIFKDQNLDRVTQLLGQGKEAVAAKKLEKMVWLTKKKIQHLCSEIMADLSVRQKEVADQKTHTTQPVTSLNNENQINCGKDHSKNLMPSHHDADDDPHKLMFQDFRQSPGTHMQDSFQHNLMPGFCQQIWHYQPRIPLPIRPIPPAAMYPGPLFPFRISPSSLLHYMRPPQVTPAAKSKFKKPRSPCLRKITLTSEPPSKKQPQSIPESYASKQNIVIKKENDISLMKNEKRETIIIKEMSPKEKLAHVIHAVKSVKEPTFKTHFLEFLFDRLGRSALNIVYKVTEQSNFFFGSLTIAGVSITRQKTNHKNPLKSNIYKKAYTILRIYPLDVIIDLGNTKILKGEKLKLMACIKKIQKVLASQEHQSICPKVLLHKINKSLEEKLKLCFLCQKIECNDPLLRYMGRLSLGNCTLAVVLSQSAEGASKKTYIYAMKRLESLSANEIVIQQDL